MRTRNHGIVCLVLGLAGCASEQPRDVLDVNLARDAQVHYAALVLATYQDTLQRAEELDQAISDFVSDPSATGLQTARETWRAGRESYLLTEAFRFYGGPIDDLDGLINAWPLDENYVDYVEGDPEAGLINDLGVTIAGCRHPRAPPHVMALAPRSTAAAIPRAPMGV